MSLFQCENCGCCENTALTHHGHAPDLYQDYFDWSGLESRAGKQLCSACSPTHYNDGTICRKAGKWHGQFKRVYLPKGEFFTNKVGNLEHRETGSENFHLFEVKG